MKEKSPETAEKIKAGIVTMLANLSETEQINLLTQRLTNAEIDRSRFLGDLDRLKLENGRVSLLERKLSSAEKMLSKTELSKSKLEQLCRELNKAQKEEKEQNQQQIKQLRKTHDETVAAFKKSLNDIQQSVQTKQEHNSKVEEVERLSDNLSKLAEDYDSRLKELKQLYENREADVKQIAKTKEDELGLMKKELDSVRNRITEVWQENVGLKKELLNSEEKARLSMEAEIGLRKLLDDYSSKYAKLLKSLNNSNDSFDRVKKEMERMNGNMIKLESESRKWKTKVEVANKELKALSAESKAKDELLALKDRQLAQLQELCRRLKNDPTVISSKPVAQAKAMGPVSQDSTQSSDANPKTIDGGEEKPPADTPQVPSLESAAAVESQ